jgi:hypothetical protein
MTGVEDSPLVGRLTRDSALIGYLSIDSQQWSFVRREGFRSHRWSEVRRRYRLDLLDDWDEGFLDPEDEADLRQGRFRFKGEVLRFEELSAPERERILVQRFSRWT